MTWHLSYLLYTKHVIELFFIGINVSIIKPFAFSRKVGQNIKLWSIMFSNEKIMKTKT